MQPSVDVGWAGSRCRALEGGTVQCVRLGNRGDGSSAAVSLGKARSTGNYVVRKGTAQVQVVFRAP